MKTPRKTILRLFSALALTLSGATACALTPAEPGAIGFVWMGDDHVYSIAQDQSDESGQLLRTDRKLRTKTMRLPKDCWMDLSTSAISRIDDHRFAVVLVCETPTLYVYDTARRTFEKRSTSVGGDLIAFEPTMTTGFQATACEVQRLRWDGHDYTSETVDLGPLAQPVCVHGNGVSDLQVVTVDGRQELLYTVVSAEDGDLSRWKILAQDVETGQTRVIRDDLVGRNRSIWATASSDGGTLFVTGANGSDGKDGIWRIDVRSGRMEQVRSGPYYRLSLSPDERTLFVQRFDGDAAVYEFVAV